MGIKLQEIIIIIIIITIVIITITIIRIITIITVAAILTSNLVLISGNSTVQFCGSGKHIFFG